MSDPKNLNYPNLNLTANSPAIDGGVHLTVAVGNGSNSRNLTVGDALYFQDGSLGSDLARKVTLFPDWIAIGSINNVVEIKSIDYSTNTITLASPTNWSNGDKIWLYKKSDGERVLYGNAPDYGTHEYHIETTPTTYFISVSKSGSGSGTITGTGINCGSDCTETHANGTTITLTATPNTGSVFAGWSGACSGTSTCTINVNNNVSVVAVFNLIKSNNPIIKYSYTLEPKWNLYSLPVIINIDSSNCNNSKLVYAQYDKTAKKFVRITEPQPGKAYWVYNKGEKCSLTATILNPTKIEQLSNLTQGWNFVAVIPDLNNKKANQLGNCMIEATMQYNPTTKTWTNITNNTINNILLGTAIATYTNNNCKI